MFLCFECEALTGYSLTWTASATPAGRAWGVLGRSAHRTSGIESGLSEGWKSPVVHEPGINPERLTGKVGHRCYDKETGRLAQTGLTQQVEMANWLTPKSCDGRDKGTTVGDMLENQVKDWPTPTIPNREPEFDKSHRPNSGGIDLQSTALQQWASPQANDDKGFGTNTPGHSPQLRHCYEKLVGQQDQDSRSTNGKPRGSLNAAWVAQLMGFPTEYAAGLIKACLEFSAMRGCRKSQT